MACFLATAGTLACTSSLPWPAAHRCLCCAAVGLRKQAAVCACTKLPSLLLTAASIWFWHLPRCGPPLWTAGGSLLKTGAVFLLPGSSEHGLLVTGCSTHLPTNAGKRVLAHAHKICNPLHPGECLFPSKVCGKAQPLMLHSVHAEWQAAPAC